MITEFEGMTPYTFLVVTDNWCMLYLQSDDSELDVVDTNKQVGHVRSPVKKSSPVNQPEAIVDLSDTFPVHIAIERAFHLPNVVENR